MFKATADKVRRVFEQPVNKALDRVAGLFSNEDQLSVDEKQVMVLIKAVLPGDPEGREAALGRFRARLEKQNMSELKIAHILDFLRQVAPGDPEGALSVLKRYEKLKQREVISNLLALAIDHGEYREKAFELINNVAVELGISDEEFTELSDSVKNASNNRSKIIRSSTGIILALIVILVFVMIATWLSSLLFGLALAYIFLPLEQYFERRLRHTPGSFGSFFRKLKPLSKIRKKLRKTQKFELAPDELKRREDQMITTKATTLTVSCVVVGGLIVLLGVIILLNSYFVSLKKDFAESRNKHNVAVETTVQTSIAASGEVAVISPDIAENTEKSAVSVENTDNYPAQTPGFFSRMGSKIRNIGWVKRMFPEKAGGSNEVAEIAPSSSYVDGLSLRLIKILDNLKLRFQKLPLVKGVIDELSEYLAAGKAEKHLTELVLTRSGGIFAFLGKFIAMFATFLLNILLTFFFFSLLLSKLAGFVNSRSGKDKDSQATSYLIRTVFNGNWLPKMSEENLRSGDRIVGEVINKLRIWLRGYMTMVAIDFCVYSIVFSLLGVPYALVLGAVAGVGILLPYIGPVSSALLTVLVTLAVGGADVSVLQIAGIIGIYLIHNGIIEQFFIYPWIIGESLGLTTLETIIVVLLGGILAGIPGMIFALPTASVVKYLVPQIYRCWR